MLIYGIYNDPISSTETTKLSSSISVKEFLYFKLYLNVSFICGAYCKPIVTYCNMLYYSFR